MRPSQHGSNKKSRADLIWGGERDRKDQKQREIYNQKRSKENLIGEEMNKIVLFGRLTRYSLIHETRMEATQNVKEN